MTSDHGWLIKAIEEAAVKRASAMFDRDYIERYIHIYGINLKQIFGLIQFYETTTGKRASDIPEDAPRPEAKW